MTCKLTVEDLPTTAGIALSIINVIISLVAICGNLLIFYIVHRNANLWTRTIVCLISLATTDLLVGVALEPLFVMQLVSTKLAVNCNLNAARRFLTAMLTGASMSTIAVISYDRFMHLSKTVNYDKYMTKGMVTVLIALSWLLPISCTFFKYIGEDELVYSGSIFTYSLIMMAIILVSYVKIMRIIQLKKRSFGKQSNDVINKQAEMRREQKLLRTQERAAKAIRLIFLCFGLFIVPITMYHGIAAISKFSSSSESSAGQQTRGWRLIFYAVAMTISMANSAVNPIIYYYRIPEFKSTARRVLNTISLSSNHEEVAKVHPM